MIDYKENIFQLYIFREIPIQIFLSKTKLSLLFCWRFKISSAKSEGPRGIHFAKICLRHDLNFIPYSVRAFALNNT